MSKRTSLAMLAFAALALSSQRSNAESNPASCLRDARRSFNECSATCREDLQSTKDGCLNKDHACVEGCRAGRAACVDESGLREALAACEDTLGAARATCRETTAPDSPERDACIDAAQEVAFQCRDAAREAARPAIDACRAAFRSCVDVCPAGSGTPAENPRLCRREANRAFATCRRTCRDDLQLDRDNCLKRDHACVEACRDGRAECLQPLRSQLTAALAECARTGRAAVATCETLYAAGTPELDQCIDNAQLAAFTCRDDAHEAVRPRVVECRQAFRACAAACPLSAE